VLVSIDTLRADHLGCYGHPLDVSPRIDRLAREGLRFADASVQWPSTWPSMASMLTGTGPGRTGVPFRPRRPLQPHNLTLAEMLKQAGYTTGAVVSNVNLGRSMRFDQGFDWFLESWSEGLAQVNPTAPFVGSPGRVKQFTDASRVTDQALAWLEQRERDTPFFLWVHYMDPHGPYVPPARYFERFRGAYPEQLVELDRIPRYQRQRPSRSEPFLRDLGFYKARYAAEIRYLDDELGRLLDALERRWGDAPGLVALTADHGESLDEHDYYLAHGALPFQPATRVPLLLHMPGRVVAGRVVEEPVALVSLVPTLLDLLGVPTPAGVEGASLAAFADAGAPAPAPGDVFGQAGTELPPHAFVRRGRFKLVRFARPEEIQRFGGEQVLYDLARDPGETRDALAEHPEQAADLARALDRWLAESGAPPEGASGPAAELGAEESQMLRALGYAH
jgi:arylsulfatase A-like enzyme